mmetsp:Transcript_561/g.2161  ORF Transcript_561/g.2161 Transcript_561/m.2161 type:complete len:253 (-) Transcript_561:2502-3260(-)
MRHRRQAPFPRRRLRRRGQDEPAADAQRQLHRTRARPRRAVDARRPGGERGVRRDVSRIHVRRAGQGELPPYRRTTRAGQGDEGDAGARARVQGHQDDRGPTVQTDVRGRRDPAARPEARGRRRGVPRLARARRRRPGVGGKLVRRGWRRRRRHATHHPRRGDLVRGAARVDPVPGQRRRGAVLRVVPQGGRGYRRVAVARVRSNRRRRGARERDGSRVAPVDRRAKPGTFVGGAGGGGGHASDRSVQAVAK